MSEEKYAEILKRLDAILFEIRKSMNPATQNQIRFIEDICDTLRIEKPEGFPHLSFEDASEFISKHTKDFYTAKKRQEAESQKLPPGVRRQYF